MPLATIADLHACPPDELVNYIRWASDLKDIYEAFIKKDDDDVVFTAGWHGAKSRDNGIHASELSGSCQRPTWYSLRGVERKDNELDPFWKKRFRIGQMYHAMIQDDWRRLCEKSGGLITCQREVRIHPSLQSVADQYNIHSSGDLVINFHDQPWGAVIMRIGVEIKTESPDEFPKVTSPRPSHLRQTCVYMRCLDLPLMWTMYVNKGNQNIHPSTPPYLYQFDEALWNQIEGEVRQIRHLATINEYPARSEGISCQFCGFSWECKPASLAKKQARDDARKKRDEMAKRIKRVGQGGLRTPRRTL